MPLWVAISLAAAFLQNARTALQKTLTPRVGIIGATYARFLFAAPWAMLVVAALLWHRGIGLPHMGAAFAAWALLGAVAQIAGTLLLLHLFSLRNYAVGNTFARTDPAVVRTSGRSPAPIAVARLVSKTRTPAATAARASPRA